MVHSVTMFYTTYRSIKKVLSIFAFLQLISKMTVSDILILQKTLSRSRKHTVPGPGRHSTGWAQVVITRYPVTKLAADCYCTRVACHQVYVGCRVHDDKTQNSKKHTTFFRSFASENESFSNPNPRYSLPSFCVV